MGWSGCERTFDGQDMFQFAIMALEATFQFGIVVPAYASVVLRHIPHHRFQRILGAQRFLIQFVELLLGEIVDIAFRFWSIVIGTDAETVAALRMVIGIVWAVGARPIIIIIRNRCSRFDTATTSGAVQRYRSRLWTTAVRAARTAYTIRSMTIRIVLIITDAGGRWGRHKACATAHQMVLHTLNRTRAVIFAQIRLAEARLIVLVDVWEEFNHIGGWIVLHRWLRHWLNCLYGWYWWLNIRYCWYGLQWNRWTGMVHDHWMCMRCYIFRIFNGCGQW